MLNLIKTNLNQHRIDVVMVHQMRISNKMLNIRHCLDKYRMHIHSLVTKLQMLRKTKILFKIAFYLNKNIETYDQIYVHRNQRPNCNCNDCEQLLYHRITNHFHMFPMSMFHLCTKRIDHNCLDGHRPGRDSSYKSKNSKIRTSGFTCSPYGSGQCGAAAPCAKNKNISLFICDNKEYSNVNW